MTITTSKIDSAVTSPDLCSITLVGNLVKEPQIRYQANPVLAICEITLATHSRWYDKSSNSYKEWTSYHPVKVIGELVEQSLLHAQKGQIVVVQGHLSHQKKLNKELFLATFIQLFSKGYSQEINQLHCSGTLTSVFTLNTTENNKLFAQATISISQQTISVGNQQKQRVIIERPVHIWGAQAQYLSEKAQVGDNVIIEGKLSYLKTSEKAQLIEAKQIILIK